MKSILIVCLLFVLFLACGDDQLNSPIDKNSTPPDPVTNIEVENLPGSAKITYDLPEDSNLLYVKAVYQINPQTTRETKSSLYNNHVIVDGFGEVREYEVQLYSVARGESESEPVAITVEPLTPSIINVFESLEVQEDFGGINVTFLNEDGGDVVIGVITEDDTGEWISAENFYTSRRDGDFSVRGFEAEERSFGVYVRDRWENYSDTLYTSVIPMFEMALDKSRFSGLQLPGDAGDAHGWVLTNLWDDDLATGYHSPEGGAGGFPLTFTMDLGAQTRLSRMMYWQRQEEWIYAHGNPKHMEVWGSNNPASDGSFNGWTKLMDVESFKPSGLPAGQFTNEDVEHAASGEEFVFPLDTPSVRYIRFRVIESWVAPPNSPTGFIHFMELSFWGQEE